MPNFWRFNLADITPFVFGSRGRGINLGEKNIFLQEKTFVTEKLNFFSGIKFRKCYQIKYFAVPDFCEFAKKSRNRETTLKYFGHGKYFIWEFSVSARLQD